MIAPWPLRLARATRHLPWFRGLSALLKVYQRTLPSDAVYRIEDFDGDLKLDVSLRETVGINLWHAPQLHEKEERKLFCSTVGPATVVLDVGANVGIYTLLAAKRGAQVFAVEADPDNAKALRHHVELNGFSDRVTVFEMAATDSAQPLKLYRNPRNRGGSSLFGQCDPVQVEGRTLDSLDLPPLDLCKMDIEGAEAQALRGMQATLARSPQMKLLVECSCLAGSPEPLLSLLHAEFAWVSIVGGGRLVPSEGVPPYCNLWAHH